MSLELVTKSYEPHYRTDRASQDLRAYVRSEWRGDASWLRKEASRKPLLARLRARLASRRPAPPFREPAAESPPYAEPGFRVEPVSFGEPCPHPELEELGLSGGVAFLRCSFCGDVLVVEGSQAWSLDADPSSSGGDPLPA